MKKYIFNIFLIGLISLAILLLIDSYYESYFENTQNVEHSDKQFWIINQLGLDKDFAVIGSSRADVSFDVRTIEEIINKKGLNIACGGCSFKENYLLLEIFLRRNKIRDFLIVNIDEYSLNSINSFSNPFHEYYYLKYLEDGILGDIITEDMNERTKIIYKYIPGIKYIFNNNVYSFRNTILSKFRGKNKFSFTDSRGSRLRFTENNGNIELPRKKENTIIDQDIFYLDKLCSLASKNNLKIYFVTAPIYNNISKFQTNRDSVYSFIEGYTNDKMININNDYINRNISYFDNYTHVNSKGAYLFSKNIANYLNSKNTYK
jgi:hypothetical protein